MYLNDPNAGKTIHLFKEKRILAGLANLPTRLQMTSDSTPWRKLVNLRHPDILDNLEE